MKRIKKTQSQGQNLIRDKIGPYLVFTEIVMDFQPFVLQKHV